LDISVNKDLKLFSRPGETAEAFALRCDAAADEAADEQTAALKEKYEAKVDKLRDQIDEAENRVDVLKEERRGRRGDELLSTAGSILGGLLGGRKRGGIGGLLRGAAGRRSKSAVADERVDSAADKVVALQRNAEELEAELAEDVMEIDARWTAAARSITTSRVTLERTDVSVSQLVLAWVPVA
jgi:phage host-nuclease inhibitor protein Gam